MSSTTRPVTDALRKAAANTPIARNQSMRDNILLKQGDVIIAKVEAVVVPVNNDLMLNMGLAARVKKLGGKKLEAECNKIGKIELGEAAIVKISANRVKAKHIIFAACFEKNLPIAEEALVACTRNALMRAREHKIATVAFPPFDTTGTTFPVKRCAEQMISEILRSTEKDTTLEQVQFYLEDDITHGIFVECLKQI